MRLPSPCEDWWRGIMTLPFFTNKVVHSYSDMWEEEMDLVVDDLKKDEMVKTKGLVIRKAKNVFVTLTYVFKIHLVKHWSNISCCYSTTTIAQYIYNPIFKQPLKQGI
jgi:hypothetical protein